MTEGGGRGAGGEAVRGGAAALALAAKRGLDVLLSSALLALAAPVLALAALAIWLEDGPPIFYVQERVGRGGRSFRLIKLRSMKVNRIDPEALGEVRAGNALVLRAGELLRRFKIDELPQLGNVLVGDMSLVGPRPTIRSQVERYDAFQARRLDVRPGLSGWAQIHGNTRLPWEQRILLDVWYVDHWSLDLDVRILLSTARVVLLGERPDGGAIEEAERHAQRRRRCRREQ